MSVAIFHLLLHSVEILFLVQFSSFFPLLLRKSIRLACFVFFLFQMNIFLSVFVVFCLSLNVKIQRHYNKPRCLFSLHLPIVYSFPRYDTRHFVPPESNCHALPYLYPSLISVSQIMFLNLPSLSVL